MAEALRWTDVVGHAHSLGVVEETADGWLGLAVRLRDERTVRVRIETVLVGRELHLGAVTGGRPASRVALTDVLAWNATLPPGAAMVLHDGEVWMRFLAPLARLTVEKLTRLIRFVAREGARWVSPTAGPAGEACAAVFVGFAE